MRLVRVTAANPHWGFVLNRYPGRIIGVALYLKHWGLSWVWGFGKR